MFVCVVPRALLVPWFSIDNDRPTTILNSILDLLLLPQTTHRSPLRSMALWTALLFYTVLCVCTLREVGLVGEVVQSWSHGAPGHIVVSTEPLRWASGVEDNSVGHRFGPLVASKTRPIASVLIGDLALPVAVNQYTGGPPDWPARVLYAGTGSVGAVLVLHGLLGALFIVLVHRFLWFHGTRVAAAIAAMLLATDWGFVFYRRALGGTELVLLAAGLLCLWALWSRRWGGGVHGLHAMGIGVGLGLLAKLTFVLTLGALALTALLLRRDKPALRPPLPARPWMGLILAAILVLPLAVAAIHHYAVAQTPHVLSHDFVGMQWGRVWNAITGGDTPARESVAALWAWLGDSSVFLETAYGAKSNDSAHILRWLGWVPVVIGAGLAWRDKHPTPHIALLRFTSIFMVLQLGILWWVARDLHHLAQVTPIAAIVAGLAMDQLASLFTPPRSPARARACLILALPWIIGGGTALWRTDKTMATIDRPSVTTSGQAAIVDMLERNSVQRVTAVDYEMAGVLETLLPEVKVINGWAVASRKRGEAIAGLLTISAGGHLLSIPTSPPWIYNLKLRPSDLDFPARQADVVVEAVDRLADGEAVLYAVRHRKDLP